MKNKDLKKLGKANDKLYYDTDHLDTFRGIFWGAVLSLPFWALLIWLIWLIYKYAEILK